MRFYSIRQFKSIALADNIDNIGQGSIAACKSAPLLKILFLGIAFLFSTLKNHRRPQCTLEERISIQEFANGVGMEDLEALIAHKVFAECKGRRRFSKSRVRYYSNSVLYFLLI